MVYLKVGLMKFFYLIVVSGTRILMFLDKSRVGGRGDAVHTPSKNLFILYFYVFVKEPETGFIRVVSLVSLM